MKYLQKIESVSEESDFHDVKDIFLDIVDEYDIYNISSPTIESLTSGIYYAYKFINGKKEYNKPNFFRIEIYLISGVKPSENRFNLDLIKKLKNDLENFKNRINQIGFDAEFRNELDTKKILSGIDIIISKRD